MYIYSLPLKVGDWGNFTRQFEFVVAREGHCLLCIRDNALLVRPVRLLHHQSDLHQTWHRLFIDSRQEQQQQRQRQKQKEVNQHNIST